MMWEALVEHPAYRFASITKRADTSSRLDLVKIDDLRQHGKDDYEALDKLTKRMNQLALAARMKDGDDEAKVRFLTRAVASTKRGSNAQQRAPIKPTFQRLMNALYTSIIEADTYRADKNGTKEEPSEIFRKSF